jgi:hypothetical protein
MEVPVHERGGGRPERKHSVGRTSRWWRGAFEIRRQETAVRARRREALLCRRFTGKHRGAVVRARLRANEDESTHKQVERHVVAVGPDAELRVIVEVRIREGIPVVRAGRIVHHRDGNAFDERRAARLVRQLGNHPAIGERVITHDGIAAVGRVARRAKALPQRAQQDWAEERGPRLREHREVGVHDFDDLVGSDRRVRVGWRVHNGERSGGPAHAFADPVEARHRLERGAAQCRRMLHDGIGASDRSRRGQPLTLVVFGRAFRRLVGATAAVAVVFASVVGPVSARRFGLCKVTQGPRDIEVRGRARRGEHGPNGRRRRVAECNGSGGPDQGRAQQRDRLTML